MIIICTIYGIMVRGHHLVDLETGEAYSIKCERLKNYNGSMGWWTVAVQDHHIVQLYRQWITNFIWLEDD